MRAVCIKTSLPLSLPLRHAPLYLVTVMLEGGGNNVLQQDLMKAIKVAVKECQAVVRAIQQLAQDAGKPKRPFTNASTVPEEVLQAVRLV